MTAQLPYSVPYDLTGLTDRGMEMRIEPAPSERAAIAKWLGAAGVDSLAATVRLKRLDEDRFRYEADYSAGIVQRCVVTLDPVPSHLEAAISRIYRLGAGARPRKSAASRIHMIADLNEEEEEALEGPVLDLAAPVLEEISLGLDPYPRVADAAFSPGTEVKEEPASGKDSPFAILLRLKEKGPGASGSDSKNPAKPSKKRGG